MIFSKTPEIYSTIDEYVGWKADRHPLIAGGQRSLLYRFAREYKIDRVEDIREEQIAFFIGQELTAFYSQQAMKAIRSFLWFCVQAGFNVVSYRMVTEQNLRNLGRKPDWEMIKKVKVLKGRGLSYNEVAAELSSVLGKRVHRTSVIRWWQRSPQLP